MKDLLLDKFKQYYPNFFKILNLEKINNLLVESDTDTLKIIREVILKLYDSKATLQSSDVLYIDDNPISIETSRYIRNFISFKPDNLSYRFVLIMNPQNMTLQAANALLKSLEESKDYIVFLSFTSDSHKIIKTILSRSFNFKLNPIYIKDTIEKKYLDSINGSFGRYLAYLQNPIKEIKISNLQNAIDLYLNSFYDDNPLYFIDRDTSFNFFKRFDALEIFLLFEEKISKLPKKEIKTAVITDLSERLVSIKHSQLDFIVKLKKNLELNLNYSAVLLALLNKLSSKEVAYA